MAHIFIGDESKIDSEVLETVKYGLPDDFWVFAEFSIDSAVGGRNVDWLIARAATQPDQLSTLIMTEVKRLSSPLKGLINSPWEKLSDLGEWETIHPRNERDTNYYWQAVNTANALADWLWNYQRLYRDGGDLPPDEFRVWPDLLILSGQSELVHQLPQRPPNGYGGIYYDPDRWATHVVRWNPRVGIPLYPQDLERLAKALGLRPIESPAVASQVARNPHPPVPAVVDDGLATFSIGLQGLADYLRTLEARIAQLEGEVAELKRADPPEEPEHAMLPALPGNVAH